MFEILFDLILEFFFFIGLKKRKEHKNSIRID